MFTITSSQKICLTEFCRKPNNMRPSAILRTLSFQIPARPSASPAVAPLPFRTPFDQQVTAQLDTLRSQNSEFSSAAWLVNALGASSTMQKIALESLPSAILGESDRIAVNEYLDNSIDMLDACNELSEKVEVIRKYLQSLKRVSKALDGMSERSPASLARARCLLDSCEAIERSSCDLDKKDFRKLLSHKASNESGLSEILTGSRAVASMVCAVLQLALSFKSRHVFPSRTQLAKPLKCSSSWLSALNGLQKGINEESKKGHCFMLWELRETVMAARELRNQLKQKGMLRDVVEELERRGGELEERLTGLEGKVKELYKQLICVRMALLGMLSKA